MGFRKEFWIGKVREPKFHATEFQDVKALIDPQILSAGQYQSAKLQREAIYDVTMDIYGMRESFAHGQ
jgi:hypothetical protein